MVSKMKQTAVDRCAAVFGSLAELARVCVVDVATPCHWNRPTTKKNGRGGAIPDRYHRRILAAVKKRNLPLQPGDLINV